MPSAKRYETDIDSPLWKAQNNVADKEFDERQKKIERNRNYYDGKHQKPLQLSGVWDDNVILNISRQAVDRQTAFLFPSMPTFNYPEQESDDLENALDFLWEQLGGVVFMQNMAISGAVSGHVYVRMIPPRDANELPGAMLLDGSKVISFWSTDNKKLVLWYEVRWQEGKTEYKQDIVRDMMFNEATGETRPGDGWTIYEFKKKGTKWEADGEPIEWELPHPFAPIIAWQHYPAVYEHYGQDEFQHATLNDAINKIASDINRILRFHAHPRTIGTGMAAEEVQETGIDNFWTVENENARISNIEMQSELVASTDMLNTLMNMYFAESRVTMLHGQTPESFKGVTNLGIRAAFMDMIAKNEVLRRTYGDAIIRISHTLMLLANVGYVVEPLELEWGDALPINEGELIQNVAAEMNLGLLSPQTASKKVGLDYTQEQQNMIDARFDSELTAGFLEAGTSG